MLINHLSSGKIDLQKILCEVKLLAMQIQQLSETSGSIISKVRTGLASGECSPLEVECLELIAAELEIAHQQIALYYPEAKHDSPQIRRDFANKLTPKAKRNWKLKKNPPHNTDGNSTITDQEIQQAIKALKESEERSRYLINTITAGTEREQTIAELKQYIYKSLDLDEILNTVEDFQSALNIAIQQSELYQQLLWDNQQLKDIAMVDQLTHIHNRRFFDYKIDSVWQDLFREQHYLTLLICDIDYFKQYNDTYGHADGDICLTVVAQSFQHAVKRSTDVIARYGGEEFAIILPRTNLSGAIQVAQEIHQTIQQLKIPHISSPIEQFLTLSIGIVTTIPSADMIPMDIIQAADHALYRAKAQGRNCWVVS